MLFFIISYNMKFTVGVITRGNFDFINKIINSTRQQQIPDYEIIIVGGKDDVTARDTRWINIDETTSTLCRKKNYITEYSTGDIIVYMHDYVSLCDDWYKGFEQFGYNWDICMTRVLDIYKRRFYDWIAWDHPTLPRYYPLPYTDKESSRYTFIPGGYWVAKKHVMEKYPLNNILDWGQYEDIEWTMRVRHLNYVMNPYSSVIHLKKHRGFDEHTAMSEKY